jgi:hypothetical protein
MRLTVAALLVGLLAGYLGHAYTHRIPGGVQHQVDTVRLEVAQADSGEAVRRGMDEPAKHLIAHLRDAAGIAQFLAKRDSIKADSLRSVLDTQITTLNQLRMGFQRLDSLRQRQILHEREAADSLQLALSHATERWQAADAAARDLTRKLHDALDRIIIVARAGHRCGVGFAGPLGLSQRGIGVAVAGGFSCRL